MVTRSALPNYLQTPDVHVAMTLLGVDATTKEVQNFLSLYSRVQVRDIDVEYVRREIESDKSCTPYKKAERLLQIAQILLSTDDGRSALRLAIQRSKREDLLGLFGVNEANCNVQKASN